MKQSISETANTTEKLSGDPYEVAFKEFEDSLQGSSEQDSIKARWAASIIKQMNMISWANKLYKDLGNEERLDHFILLEVLDMIYINKRCDEHQLFKYIELQFEIKIFEKKIAKWHDDEYALPFGLEYFLMGLPMKFVNHENLGILSERYGKLYCDFYFPSSNSEPTDYMVDYVEKTVELIKDLIGEENYKVGEDEVQ